MAADKGREKGDVVRAMGEGVGVGGGGEYLKCTLYITAPPPLHTHLPMGIQPGRHAWPAERQINSTSAGGVGALHPHVYTLSRAHWEIPHATYYLASDKKKNLY